jgi:hypothetical protein
MKVFISTPTFDVAGDIELDVNPDTDFLEISRRVSRIATVDGGVAINDGGYSDGDILFDYTWRTVSKAHNDSIARIVKLYPTVKLSTIDGVFLAAPSTFTPGVTESTLQLLSIRKLSS